MRRLLSRLRGRSSKSTLDPAPSELKAPPRPKSICFDARLNAPLEKLPAEIRRHLLFTLDLTAMKALISASPVYHQQYRLDQRLLLKSCLENELRSIIPDACAVHQSSSEQFSAARTEETITKFLKACHETRSSSTSLQSLSFNNGDEAEETKKHKKQELTTEDVSRMALFHTTVILPMAQEFTKWTLTNLSKHANKPTPSSAPLSSTGKTRVIRALYRFQLYCNLFGMGHYDHHKYSRLRFDSADVLRLMLCPFQPWEVEEIASIALFAKTMYNGIFDRVKEDLEETHPRFADQFRPPTPVGAFHLEPIERHDLLIGTSSRGLKVLHKALTLTHSNTRTSFSSCKDISSHYSAASLACSPATA